MSPSESELLAQILSLEEQLNAQAERLDNVMHNFVELSRAVRSLTEKVERFEQQLDEGATALRRRASDEEPHDPTVQPLIESALHIERGDYQAAVRCLEAARHLGDNPKLEQALALSRHLLENQKR